MEELNLPPGYLDVNKIIYRISYLFSKLNQVKQKKILSSNQTLSILCLNNHLQIQANFLNNKLIKNQDLTISIDNFV